MSDSGSRPPFPWLYAYQEDGPRLDSIVQRPVAPMVIVGADVSPPVYALVDSGCEHVLAGPWMADAAGVDAKLSGRHVRNLGIGGQNLTVDFADVRLRLLAPGHAGEDKFYEWEAEVGFPVEWKPTWPMIVGQVGFFDKFTVTMSRLAMQVAVEPREVFDERFGVPLAPDRPSFPARHARL